MIGRHFLSAVRAKPDNVELLKKLNPNPEWFFGVDREIFDFVMNHIDQHKAFPNSEALGPMEFPEATEEPTYYFSELKKQYGHHVFTQGINHAIAAFNKEDADTAITQLSDLVSHYRDIRLTGGAQGKSDVIDAHDLWDKHVSEPNWVVPGILPTGLTILAGKPKCGKSWLAYDIALNLAVGGQVLGANLDESSCLMLALEDTVYRLKDRMHKLMGNQQPPPNKLKLVQECSSGTKGLRESVLQCAGVKLVVIDTLARFRNDTGHNSNQYAKDYKDVADLKQIADELGIGILLIHHTRKAASLDPFDEVSGTLGLTGSADSIAVLKRTKDSEYGTLHLRGRDIEEQATGLKFDHGKWQRHGDFEKLPTSKEAQIMNLVELSSSPISPKELSEKIGTTAEAARKSLERMAKNGFLFKFSHGKYGSFFNIEHAENLQLADQQTATSHSDDSDKELG